MAALSPNPLAQQLFYRQPLPDTCISFCSPEGRAIFREALLDGYMESYFDLASQFRTQDEPAFCGLSTLVMVLNALEVDPLKVWKGPWRWYHEDMLDCCVPLAVIENLGITFDQFACLAVCNTLDVRAFRADNGATEQVFRDHVTEVSRCTDEVVVVSYARKALNQSGGGHFSPIGGYHRKRDLVLILDVARFKYPPHWVPLPDLFRALQCVDPDTGLPRGYMKLSLLLTPTVLFHLVPNLCVTGDRSEKLGQFWKEWRPWLDWLATSVDDSILKLGVRGMIDVSVGRLTQLFDSKKVDVVTTLDDAAATLHLSDEHRRAMTKIVKALENLPLFSLVGKHLGPEKGRLGKGKIPERSNPAEPRGAPYGNVSCLGRVHHVAMLLLIWPYESAAGSYAGALAKSVTDEMAETSALLRNEVNLLRRQMSSVFDYVRFCKSCIGKA